MTERTHCRLSICRPAGRSYVCHCGLAADRRPGNCRRDGRAPHLEPGASAALQIWARYALRMQRPGRDGSEVIHYLSWAQRRTAARDGQNELSGNEVSGKLACSDAVGYFRVATALDVQSEFV